METREDCQRLCETYVSINLDAGRFPKIDSIREVWMDKKQKRIYGIKEEIKSILAQISYLEDDIKESQEDLIWEKHKLTQAENELRRIIEKWLYTT